MAWMITCCLCVILPTMFFNLIDSIIILKSFGSFLLGWVCVDIYTEIERKTTDKNRHMFLKKLYDDLTSLQNQYGGPNDLQSIIDDIDRELKKMNKF